MEYPFGLYNIFNRPKFLYVLGNAENLRRKCIAIVGSRKCSKKGAKNAEKLAFNLAKKNYVIVSGLARGIDTFAHIGALKAKGKTIAVLGNGLNKIYPQGNTELAKRIIHNGGTIISEYSLKTKIEKNNFSKRNRIISGISSKVIIVEAKKKSGALITANYALEQGKDIYALPGNITSENYIGTNELIKNGAQILYSCSICNII
ncbi:MAG: DNA-processing protein DprA [Clostridia bacterium]|nr:DNA-processing protein DprA [Clostridia bacterium]